IETFTSEKLPWVTTSAKHSFETYPPFENYEGLTAEYAELLAGAS
ncbi:aldehyde-activating protein, partial [Rhizobiaceae sp. 2RAB30]